MADLRRCKLCGEHGWFGSAFFGEHKCPPCWECCPEWNKDFDHWENVYAADAETAATKYAERYDCDGGDYLIVSNRMRDDPVVRVRKIGEEAFDRWSIRAEAVPTYYADKLEDSPSPQETASE